MPHAVLQLRKRGSPVLEGQEDDTQLRSVIPAEMTGSGTSGGAADLSVPRGGATPEAYPPAADPPSVCRMPVAGHHGLAR